MKAASYVTAIFLGVLCLALCAGVMAIAFVNEHQQTQLQARQQELSRGMMGPEARQIASQVLQDLASVAQRHAPLRRVLARHGYEVQRPSLSADEPAEVVLPEVTAPEPESP
jgi:hypothetical protein